MGQLHFLRPWWFFGLIPLCLIMLFLWRSKRAKGAWQAVCDAHLVPYILEQNLPARHLRYSLLLGFAAILAILALAGPTWQKLPQPLFKQQSALVVMLDLSKSMDAADLTPSRLERARLKLLDLLRLRNEGQTALIVYAGDAFVVTPLTDDTETIAALLQSLSTSLMPLQGSKTDRAVEQALELLSNAGVRKGSLLLISDDVAEDEIDKQAARVVEAGHRLSVIAVGTTEGAPIPDSAGGFVKNAAGQIVVPKLNESGLKQLARQGGGIYSRLTIQDADIKQVLALSDGSLLGSDTEQTELQTDQWREEGPWLLLLLLPIASLAFRRGILLVVLCIGLHWPDPVLALDWGDLWLNDDQKGVRAMNQQDYSGAASTFRDAQWKAAAFYRAGQYDQAVANLEHASGPDAAYNRGNALARLGHIQEAMESYEQALAEEPNHADAKYNLDLLKQLQHQQQQQNSQPDQQQNSQPDQQQKEKQEQQSGQEQRSEGEQGEGENQQPNRDQQQSRAERTQQDQSQQQNTEQSGPGPAQEAQAQQQAVRQPPAQESNEAESESSPQSQAEMRPQAQTEQQQADEQWLRRVPDDPAGLLRRKFRYQYSRRYQGSESTTQQW